MVRDRFGRFLTILTYESAIDACALAMRTPFYVACVVVVACIALLTKVSIDSEPDEVILSE